ncbi:MAG: hypothetical protein MUF20_10565 [Methylotetracoccus sp.]|nr:hypothetical protein [Methylotetracoccus sp.]
MKSLIVILSLILASTATHATPQSVTVSTTSGRTYAVAFDPNKFAGAIVQLREIKRVYSTRKGKTSYITNYIEWLNSADAGRNLQTALHTNERGECYNATQGGNWTEYSKTYVSQLVEYWTGQNSLHTKTRMAFWLRPGDTRPPQPGYCPLGHAENKTLTSDYYVTHDVSFSSVAGAMMMTFNVAVDGILGTLAYIVLARITAPTILLSWLLFTSQSGTVFIALDSRRLDCTRRPVTYQSGRCQR